MYTIKIETKPGANTMNDNEIKDPLAINAMSDFRIWCSAMWEEHRDEVFNWTGKRVDYTSDQFFRKNKLYLKSLYTSRGKDRWEF